MVERLNRIRQEITGVVSILGSLYIALSLATYSIWDPSFFVFTSLPSGNYGGVIGSYVADLMISFAGLASYIMPAAFFIYGLKRLLNKEGHRIYVIGVILLILSSSMLAALLASTFHLSGLKDAGGMAGLMLAGAVKGLLSIPGAYIFTLAAWLSSLIILCPVSLISLVVRKPSKKSKEPVEASPEDEEVLSIMPAQEEQPVPVIEEDYKANEEPVIHGGISYSEAFELADSTEQKTPAESNDVPETTSTVITRGDYQLPTVDLLRMSDPVLTRPTKEDLLSNSSLLESKLKDFDVDGKVTQVHPGPVVTMYEFEPAPGVKINRIVSLSDDLALSLKAQSVRVATLSGKAAIGIEVPNKTRETVSLREIISADNFGKHQSKLTLALGKDIFGAPVIADLAKMPHLLVAGATGSGKSVSINSMIVSILYKASPKEVKMLMIDPKLLELSSYENIPHLISPVITGAKEAAEALRRMVFEMERRYRLLAEKGVRNIEGFNSAAADEEKLPYIVIFIDELADLMFASAKEVEDSIARLAQMARASGIHLILATQRPSVDVITGVIKANFPARIAFQVTSRIDSRTIIDNQGAEQLLGRGDMLFMTPGTRIIRIHGALVTEEEIKAVTDFIKSQAVPDYSIFENIRLQAAEHDDESLERDELYEKILDFAESRGEVSISSIQRKFNIGYNKAAKVMELMEEDGCVGPQRAAGKPRMFIGRRR